MNLHFSGERVVREMCQDKGEGGNRNILGGWGGGSEFLAKKKGSPLEAAAILKKK